MKKKIRRRGDLARSAALGRFLLAHVWCRAHVQRYLSFGVDERCGILGQAYAHIHGLAEPIVALHEKHLR